MAIIGLEEREARLKAHVAAKTIARGEWMGRDETGRATACLLAAWSPEAGDRILDGWLAAMERAVGSEAP